MWEASYAIYCVATFMAFDSLFIGVCVFGIAYVNDMAELLEYADSEYLRWCDLVLNSIWNNRRILNHLQDIKWIFTQNTSHQSCSKAYALSKVYRKKNQQATTLFLFCFFQINCRSQGTLFWHDFRTVRHRFITSLYVRLSNANG